MLKVVEVFTKVGPNGTRYAAHCVVPGAVEKSMGFRIAEFNEKGQRVRFLFSSMRPFESREAAEAKLAEKLAA